MVLMPFNTAFVHCPLLKAEDLLQEVLELLKMLSSHQRARNLSARKCTYFPSVEEQPANAPSDPSIQILAYVTLKSDNALCENSCSSLNPCRSNWPTTALPANWEISCSCAACSTFPLRNWPDSPAALLARRNRLKTLMLASENLRSIRHL